MALKDLLTVVEQPPEAQIPVRCRHCQHLHDVPYYKVDGAATVCANPKIGRESNSLPCPHFSINMSIFRRLSPGAIAKLAELLALMEADARPGKTGVRQRADMEAMLELALVLRVMTNARRAGWHFGASYAISNSDISGILVSLNGTQATIKASDGIPYTVEAARLQPAQ